MASKTASTQLVRQLEGCAALQPAHSHSAPSAFASSGMQTSALLWRSQCFTCLLAAPFALGSLAVILSHTPAAFAGSKRAAWSGRANSHAPLRRETTPLPLLLQSVAVVCTAFACFCFSQPHICLHTVRYCPQAVATLQDASVMSGAGGLSTSATTGTPLILHRIDQGECVRTDCSGPLESCSALGCRGSSSCSLESVCLSVPEW